MQLTFTIPGKPRAWQRAGIVVDRQGRAHTYTTKEMREYQQMVANCAKGERNKLPGDWQMMSGPLRIKVDCYFPIAQAREKHIAEGEPHTQKPDGDNCLKNICDALSGTLWNDDCTVYHKEVTKYWTHEPPRTVVVVESL